MSKTYIIAEAGVNHNGSLEIAKQLIEVAASAGADAVKFQTFKADLCISEGAPKAEYQIATTGDNESQLSMVKKLEISEDNHYILANHCRLCNIEFLSTPFDIPSVMFLQRLGVEKYKMSSGEITNAPLLLAVARTGKPVILSTGLSTIGEVEAALGVLAFGYTQLDDRPTFDNFMAAFCSQEGQAFLKKKVKLLHCTSEYPAPFSEVNLRNIDTLYRAFNLEIGYSDHTTGIAVPIAAVARGASIVEKHFTLDRQMPGPDHKVSLEPNELKLMIQSIRQVEAALGCFTKLPTSRELKNRSVVRKSLVARCYISKGEVFSENNITAKRPNTGVSPMRYWEYIGQIADRDYKQDEVL